jgi:hypothetical protein
MFKRTKAKIKSLMDKYILKKEIESLEYKKKILKDIQKTQIKEQSKSTCYHERLNQLAEGSMWYQCNNKKCRKIFFLFGSVAYEKDILVKEQNEIRDNLKEPEL